MLAKKPLHTLLVVALEPYFLLAGRGPIHQVFKHAFQMSGTINILVLQDMRARPHFREKGAVCSYAVA